MRLTSKLFLAAAAVALSGAAGAQNTPPSNTKAPDQKQPDEPTTTTSPANPDKSSTAPGQTQSTPGQSQTSPGEASQITPATTGETPSGQTTGNAATAVTKATAADLKAGASVFDQSGAVVGKIQSVSSKGVVVDTGKTRVGIPASSFAKSDKGLVIGMTKAQIEAAAKKSSPKPK